MEEGPDRLNRNSIIKRIEAIIRPFKLDDVRKAVMSVGVESVTITEVRGFGRQKGHLQIYRGDEYSIDFVPKTKLEIVVRNENAEAVIAAVVKSAKTGKIGDGKIFVTRIDGEADV